MFPDADTAEALQAGARLGRYECIRRIAVGGMAELYLGRVVGPAGFEKLVAIKRILPRRTGQEEFVRMFEQEARTAATLDHGNVVKVMDFGVAHTHHYLVMEYLHGRDLLDLQRKHRGPLPLDLALTIVIAVAHGLHYVHERKGTTGRPLGLVHRDVSPSNIFLCFSGDVKVVDFGLAKATEATMGTQSGTLKGKIGYMSPEQCRGEPLDRRTDVHALGNVLYGLTTGRRMYSAENEFALLNKVATGEFVRPSRLLPDYPPALEAILLRATAFDPAARWQSAVAFAEALEAFALQRQLRLGPSLVATHLAGAFGAVPYPTIGPSPALVPADPVVQERPPITSPRRWPVPAAIAAVGALGAGTVLGVWLSGSTTAAPPNPATAASPVSRPSEPARDAHPEPAPASVQPSSPSPEAEVEAPILDAEAQPEPPPPTSKRARPRRRRRPSKNRRSHEPESTKPAHADLFTPPSQRD